MNRYTTQRLFGIAVRAAALLVVGVLLLVIGVTVVRGGGVLLADPSIVLTPPGSRYMLEGTGGFLHAVLGSLFIVGPATIVSMVAAVSTAVYLQSDYSSKRFSDAVNMFLNVLWGTPPIVYGVFVLTIIIATGAQTSLFFGIVAIAIFQYPIMTRYTDEALRAAPETVRESTYGLGATRFESMRMTVRAAAPGVIAGLVMGFARGIGDAATVLFTTGRSTRMPGGLFEAATTLPVLIFDQAMSFNPEVRSHAYAAAFVLTIAVLGLILLSKLLAGRYARYTPGGNR
ncbi:ABC transporter permease [Halorubrum ezzemoulense]|jgi:phosphate transport system permease protein|uniref:ABC transporter permease n=2 Tax=Halorubrum ezzemoulense TaxID=337243 RepID=A0A1X4H9B6_HALEZ|nr:MULTISPECIES: ABC transporter permease subunit [Halorubrum]MDB2225829.1 ABC transporter permease subunit [Halorubrum ezzemoulense]MDB2242739.1 ABC transporter permease subunit [Halorubrum ezzemoulense]MDB2262123.1 ABC transporter permease subunit [Halorubrum ezzemoulense]MDB2265195.1 ABC transporter permease subunit [Halorubrum ezzemoulense]MDB2268850.1 ABC transporter permease subunit [Halorubrum ezzemoulense]